MLTINSKDLEKIEAALAYVPSHVSEREAAIAACKRVREFAAEPALIDEAREIALCVEDEEDRISFDDDASTSPSDEGTFVSCWFWVPKPAAGDEQEGE